MLDFSRPQEQGRAAKLAQEAAEMSRRSCLPLVLFAAALVLPTAAKGNRFGKAVLKPRPREFPHQGMLECGISWLW